MAPVAENFTKDLHYCTATVRCQEHITPCVFIMCPCLECPKYINKLKLKVNTGGDFTKQAAHEGIQSHDTAAKSPYFLAHVPLKLLVSLITYVVACI